MRSSIKNNKKMMWIMGECAGKLREELTNLGQIVDIAETEDVNADVSHFE